MKTYQTPAGTELPMMDLKGKQYLVVAYRLVWFREERPDWEIYTTPVSITDTGATFRAEIRDPSGRSIASAHKHEDKAHFADYMEKAETGAIGRALAYLGYGTQFAPELDEMDGGAVGGEIGRSRIVDAPNESVKKAPVASAAANKGPSAKPMGEQFCDLCKAPLLYSTQFGGGYYCKNRNDGKGPHSKIPAPPRAAAAVS